MKVKDFLNEKYDEVLSCHHSVKVEVENDCLIVNSGTCEVTFNEDYFNVSTLEGCGISAEELEVIYFIKWNRSELIEMWNNDED